MPFNFANVDDCNRVVLKTLPGEEHSDYINASYVDVRFDHAVIYSVSLLLHNVQGYKRQQVYVASQGQCM